MERRENRYLYFVFRGTAFAPKRLAFCRQVVLPAIAPGGRLMRDHTDPAGDELLQRADALLEASRRAAAEVREQVERCRDLQRQSRDLRRQSRAERAALAANLAEARRLLG
jgi:hypothetical protein